MILRSMERLVNKMFDALDREHAANDACRALEYKIENLKRENEALMMCTFLHILCRFSTNFQLFYALLLPHVFVRGDPCDCGEGWLGFFGKTAIKLSAQPF